MGSYDSWKQVTRDAAAVGHKILDFRSTLSKLRLDASEPINGKGTQIARKQMYHFWKPTIATQRHRRSLKRQSALTKRYIGLIMSSIISCTTHWSRKPQLHFTRIAILRELGVQCDINVEEPVHVVDEVNEAVMIARKICQGRHHQPWKRFCRTPDKSQSSCKIGIPWPRGMNWTEHKDAKDSDGNFYNWHENTNVADYWVPRLTKAMLEREQICP
jgi:hypothetical protein